MSNFAEWLLALIKLGIKAVWDLLSDLFIALLDLLLTAVLALINALPLPSFLSATGFQSLFNNISPDILFFAKNFRLGECMAMFGAAVLFRLARKAVTLFQW